MTTVVLGPDLNGSALVVKTAHERKLSPNCSKYRVPYRKNPRRNEPRDILFKLTMIENKERILEAEREKQQVTCKGNPIGLTADLSTETL